MLNDKRMWTALGAYVLLSGAAYFLLEGVFRTAIWTFFAGLAVMTVARSRAGA